MSLASQLKTVTSVTAGGRSSHLAGMAFGREPGYLGGCLRIEETRGVLRTEDPL